MPAAGSKKVPEEAAAGGSDTNGTKYEKLSDLWTAELEGEEGRRSWYNVAEKYWHGQEASINGVLGGFPETHGPDLRDSKLLLKQLRQGGMWPAAKASRATARSAPSGTGLRVMDCGAGIGRVAKGLLMEVSDRVDLVEPNERLLEAARQELAKHPRAGSFTASSLQDLQMEAQSYDMVWVQWVLLYLPDDDLIAFLQRCRGGLRRHGLVCVKENVVRDGGSWVLDKEDNSVSRTDAQYKAIFERAGFDIVHQMQQTCWPSGLVPVKMYALRPCATEAPGVKKRPAGATATTSAKARRK